jgi:sulfatase maturation enzyme AslB (radical SAM superfamily)
MKDVLKMTEPKKESTPLPQGIHIVAKPIGPKCNLNCDYCFYLEKEALVNGGVNVSQMADQKYTTGYQYSRDRPGCQVSTLPFNPFFSG